MLSSLRIENFAIVKLLELDFLPGMTAFTGETGAGKSIMIDALLLALGERADASVIRPGEQKCDICATFRLDEMAEPHQWLLQHDLANEQHELILRRIIYQEGRSKSYINGQPFPLQKVKELSEMLVHIHGQHQHQTLMQHATHRQQLDHYAGHETLINEVAQGYKQYQKIKQELEALQGQDPKQSERSQLLQYQIDELDALALEEDEWRRLNEEHHLLHNAQDYIGSAEEIMRYLQGDEEFTLCRMLNIILQRLQSLPKQHVSIKNAEELINNALIQCEEAHSEIQHFAEAVQLDPERLQTVETRLSLLHQMARKYHVDVSQLSTHLQHLQQELEQSKMTEKRVDFLSAELIKQSKVYKHSAEKLSQSRLHFAAKLADDITAIIKQLGMPEGYVSVQISPLEKMQPHGLDKVEYHVCTNPGMIADTLNKIASGGELSRISLAIQMITAQRGATPTLFFDEVDVGIGGPTAALVGQLLRKLGERLQLFCVTHQAQVASAAHHHFVVEKISENNQTYSHIVNLSKESKVDEIARMLGGLSITAQTRSHAQELLVQHL